MSSYVQETPKLTLCANVLASINKKVESQSMENVSTFVESQGALLVIPNAEAHAPTSDKVEAKTIERAIKMHVSSPQMDLRSYEFRY